MEQRPQLDGEETSPCGLQGGGSSSPLPERIGVYRVEGRLGCGGMGEVFLAWDERLERRVAVKRIQQGSGLSSEQRERFRREARLAARLSHPAIVQIHDLVTEGADDAIVMEYVEGRTLAERLAAGRMETAEALRLAQEIATGLAAAHEAGLIHRDLKAANVIVTPAGHAKILDFGLARPVRRSEETLLTRRGMVVGTLCSMSPEQARGQEVDERSDLFSFGVLLYEMLAGRPPFQGESPVEILHHLVYEPPPSLRSLRPDVAAAVESLLDRLLAKDRRARPSSAHEVATALERLLASSGGAPLSGAGLFSRSDLPTAVGREKEPVSNVLARRLPLSTGASVLVRRRAILMGAVAVLLAVLTVTVWMQRPAAPLRVAVAHPEVHAAAGDEELGLAASGVLTAMLGSLAALQGVVAIDPREAGRGGSSPTAMARTAAAHEVLIAGVEREGTLSRVSLRRVRGSDGAVLWSETFRVPVDPGSLRLLNDAVNIHLRRAYLDHAVRPGMPELDVRDQDYVAFLMIRQRIESGETSLDSQLAQVEEIVRQSPRFLEGKILAARIALSMFHTTREPAHLDRAIQRARQSLELAPADPRPLLLEFKIALASNRERDAEEILARIGRLLPGDPDILPLRAELARQQGRPAEALEALRTAAAQVPSWQNLVLLAKLEAEQGHVREARERVAGILRQAPGNPWAQELLGALELYYGDLARAEEIYLERVRVDPRHSWTSIGVVRFLRGQYREAAAAYHRALAVDPEAIVTQLNLADAEDELGHPQAAEALCRRALDRLATSAPEGRLGLRETMSKARCLVRLGRAREAVEIAQEALQRSPDDPEILYQSALIHSLAGDRASALNFAQAALKKGMPPRWFTGSAFRSLREDPELRPFFQGVAAAAAPQGLETVSP
jgi:tetratricopeptide (TPR) repeat protein